MQGSAKMLAGARVDDWGSSALPPGSPTARDWGHPQIDKFPREIETTRRFEASPDALTADHQLLDDKTSHTLAIIMLDFGA